VRLRLLASSVLIAIAAVIVLGVPLGLVGSRLVRNDAHTTLEREADAVAGAVEDDLEAGRAIRLARASRLVAAGHSIAITGPSGRLIAGVPTSPGMMSATSPAVRRVSVTVAAPAGEVDERVRHLWLVIGLLAAGGIAAAVALGLLQGRRFARPLERLAEISARLGAGDFSARAGRQRLPEVDALAGALDRSAERVAQLVQRERAFSANVSHQLRTPLTAIRLRLEELAAMPDAAVRAEALAALAESERMERTVKDLLALARQGAAGVVGPIDAAAILRRRAAVWTASFRAHARSLDVRAGGAAIAMASAGALEQALDVLLDNALRHGGGTVAAEMRLVEGYVIVSVGDEGDGVAVGVLPGLFEGRSGGGIGLPLARALIEAGGGRLRLSRARPACFEIVLPAGEAATVTAAKAGPPAAVTQGPASANDDR